MEKQHVKDWVAQYNYFDFSDKIGIMSIGHELFRDIIEKCIELENRIQTMENKAYAKNQGKIEHKAFDVKPKVKTKPKTVKPKIEEVPPSSKKEIQNITEAKTKELK